MTTILIALAFALGFNILMFIPAFIWKTDKLTDLSYSITFLVMAIWLFAYGNGGQFSLIALLMILIWAIRLGSFLFIRIRKQTKDSRFDGMRENFWRFLKFWLLQGIAVWIIMLPTILFFQSNSTISTTGKIISFIGFIIWLSGFLIESFADQQKYKFKQNPENKDKWIETGLWKKSRHPNYLGEIMVWIGVYIFCAPFLSTTSAIVAIVSPLFIFTLIKFVSGVPLLEKSADAKWGQNPDYVKYKQESGIILPKI